MRKINTQVTVNADTFNFAPQLEILVRNEDGSKFKTTVQFPDNKYSAEQRETITLVNHAMETNGLPFVTEEEIEYLLQKIAIPDEPTEEEIQALAGFKVEKKIIYTDKHADKVEV